MLELIFIHIPKTAGSSLRALLNRIYGREAVATMGIDFKATKKPIALSQLPAGTRVLTGHLTYSQVKRLHEQSGTKIITFLREPIERYLAHYYHLKRAPVRSSGRLSELQALLPMWLHLAIPRYHNVIQEYVGPLAPSEWDFMGFQETFAQDIERLARVMDWPLRELDQWRVKTNINSEFPAHRRRLSPLPHYMMTVVNGGDQQIYHDAKRYWKNQSQQPRYSGE